MKRHLYGAPFVRKENRRGHYVRPLSADQTPHNIAGGSITSGEIFKESGLYRLRQITLSGTIEIGCENVWSIYGSHFEKHTYKHTCFSYQNRKKNWLLGAKYGCSLNRLDTYPPTLLDAFGGRNNSHWLRIPEFGAYVCVGRVH